MKNCALGSRAFYRSIVGACVANQIASLPIVSHWVILIRVKSTSMLLYVKLFYPPILTGDGSESSKHGDQCALCTEGGELLCCDTCPLAYHLACAYPSLRRIPRGNWACQVCTGADDERPRSSRVKKATIEGKTHGCSLYYWHAKLFSRVVCQMCWQLLYLTGA